MKIWLGKLRFHAPVTRQYGNKINGKEVGARVIADGRNITLETSESNDAFGTPRWKITEVNNISPMSLLQALTDSVKETPMLSDVVKLTNC